MSLLGSCNPKHCFNDMQNFFSQSSGRLYKDLLRPCSLNLFCEARKLTDGGPTLIVFCLTFLHQRRLDASFCGKCSHSLLVQETTPLCPSIRIVWSVTSDLPLTEPACFYLWFYFLLYCTLPDISHKAPTKINNSVSNGKTPHQCFPQLDRVTDGIFNEVDGVRAFLRTLMWKLCICFFSFLLKKTNIHSKQTICMCLDILYLCRGSPQRNENL